MVEKRIQTPRGNFKVKFNSIEEANKDGYYLWFEHEGYLIVANGTKAFAVNKRKEGIR